MRRTIRTLISASNLLIPRHQMCPTVSVRLVGRLLLWGSRAGQRLVDEHAGPGGGGGEGGGEDVGFAEAGEEDLGVGVAVVVVDDVKGAVSNEMREEEKSRGRG